MIETKTNITVSVLALMFLFAIVENQVLTSSASFSSLFASALPAVVGTTTLTTEEANCVDPTLTFQKRQKNAPTEYIDLCKWVLSAPSSKHKTKRCNYKHKRSGYVAKDRCNCACSTPSESIPVPAVTKPLQQCVTNTASATCPAGGPPDISCCRSIMTGAFFNVCCPTNYQGIRMEGTASKSFLIMSLLTGTGVAKSVECAVHANRRGCPMFDVLPLPTTGPCRIVGDGASCPAGETAGFCRNKAGIENPMCCPPCSTGTGE